MIDSGILAGLTFDQSDRAFSLRTLAHHAGLPVTIFDASMALRIREVLSPVVSEIEPLDFKKFCHVHSQHAGSLLRLFRQMSDLGAGTVNHFPHPLFRHMKDHLPVRQYEIFSYLLASDTLEEGKISIEDFILKDCGFRLVFRKMGSHLIGVGPLFMQDALGEGVDHVYFEPMSSGLNNFKDTIDEYWQNSDIHNRSYMTIYTLEHLRRLAFSRSKQLTAHVLEKLESLINIDQIIGDFTPDTCGAIVGTSANVKMVGAVAAANSVQADGYVACKAFGSSALKRIISIKVGALRPEVVEFLEVPSDEFSRAYAAEVDKIYQSWSCYIAESLSQLRHWLMASRPHSLPGQPADEQRKSGRRLARFLASVFHAFECTLYRVTYADGRSKLISYGSFSAGKNGRERMEEMHEHMEGIGSLPNQRQSISYRCLLENKVQYCQYYDYETGASIPEGQTFTFPTDSRISFWGLSACAIPVRINGILWGVLQLIGERPHAFPEFIRARAEEACDIIGSHLFRADLMSSVYEISRTISNQEQQSVEKREIIEETLARMFGAKTFAIVHGERPDGGEVNVFLESGRADLRDAAANNDDVEYFAPLMEFARGDERSWFGIIGGDDFKRLFGPTARRKFYEGSSGDFAYLTKISWEFADGLSLSSVAMLTFAHEMDERDNWQEAVEFACRYVATITGSLYSSDIWERKLREKIGHELSKTAGTLAGSVQRLRKVVARPDGRGRNDIESVITDLGGHARALDRYVKILGTHRDISDLDEDPRLYLIKETRAQYLNDPQRRAIRVRDVYNAAFFGQVEIFHERRVEVPKFDPFFDLRIDMDELTLREVMTTLADNILKYTKPGTELLVRADSTDRVRGIQICNIGLRLEDHELFGIFRNEVRGARARERFPDQGSGYGLWFAQRAMNIWGCGLRHSQRETRDREELWTWHDFTLSFPNRLVRWPARGGRGRR